jgi:chromosomal replication initiation ATPase DnaA
MYLSHVAFGLTFTETGRLFDRDRTTVSQACAIVEDLRDDPAMDRALSILEAALTRLRPEGP